MESSPARTIDDYFEQLYHEYKRRLPTYNSPETETETETSSSKAHGGGLSSCCHYLPLPLLALCVANSSDATEILMLSYLLADPTFRHDMFSHVSNVVDEDNDVSSMEGAEYLAASIFMGMLLGGTVLGFLSDHIGRRPALLTGLLINATAGSFSSIPFLTPTIAHLTAWRFIAGIGVGATVPSIFSLASEWSPKEIRGAVVTCVASFWMVGSLFVSGLAWILFRGFHDHTSLPIWRVFAALCAMPSALGAFMVYTYVPESPRFLASAKHNYEQTSHVCNQMAQSLGVKLTNDASCSAAIYHLDSIQSKSKDNLHEQTKKSNSDDSNANTHLLSETTDIIQHLTEEELRRSYASSIPTGITDASPTTLITGLVQTINILLGTLRKLYSRRLLTNTTLPLQAIWFALSFATYGITTWINTLFVEVHLQNIYFNSFLFALANLPGNIMSLMYSDKWGRKRMLVGSLVGAAGGLAGFAILVYSGDAGDDNNNDESIQFKSSARAYGIVLSACIFQMFSIVSWNAIDILTGELFPTRVRSAGMGVCTACGRFGGIFAQFVNARLMIAGAITGGGGGGTASASVLVVAATTLLMGACMPMFLERDMAMGELKDEVTEVSPTSPTHRMVTLGCMGRTKGPKEHWSDDEVESKDFGVRSRGLGELQSQQWNQSLREESFLL